MYVITLRSQPWESVEVLSFYLCIYILMMAGLIIGTCNWIYVFNVNISCFRRVLYMIGLLLYHNLHCLNHSSWNIILRCHGKINYEQSATDPMVKMLLKLLALFLSYAPLSTTLAISVLYTARKYLYNYFAGDLFLVFMLVILGVDIGQALNCSLRRY